MENNDQKIYIEFIFEGLIKTAPEEQKKIEAKITSMVNRIIKEHACVKVTASISKYSELDLVMSILGYQNEEEYEN